MKNATGGRRVPAELGRRIVQISDGRLRLPSRRQEADELERIEVVWTRLQECLTGVMGVHHFRHCAGLSAVQIGILVRACVVWLPGRGTIKIANPELVSQSDEEILEFEGCLSFFDKRGQVPRPARVRLRYLAQDLEPRDENFELWGARIVLHELDHMNGVLYTDRMSAGQKLLDYQTYMNLRSR